MKALKTTFIILTGLFLCAFSGFSQDDNSFINSCLSTTGDDATYLKDYVVKLPEAQPGRQQPVAKNAILLLKNTHYRFSICSSEKYGGVGILQLFDTKKMLASTYNPKTGKTFKSIDFFCTKSGQYTVDISFKDGKEGMAVGILSYVKK